MAKEIRVSPTTRLVRAKDLRLYGVKGGAPLDFGRDHLIILDADGRPAAECWPVEGAAAGAVVPTSTPGPAPCAPRNPAQNQGSLTHVHRVILEKVWADNPHARPDVIAAKFLSQTGRGVSIETAAHYKPKAGAAG